MLTTGKPWSHIHIGCGSLGLGFVAPITYAAGAQVYLANRTSPESQQRNLALQRKLIYSVRKRTNLSINSEEVHIANFLFTDTDIEALRRVVTDDRTRLITFAAKDGQAAIVPVLQDLIDARMSSSASTVPLFLMACENQISRDMAAFLQSVHPPVLCPPCIVDRICSEIEYETESDLVSVHVEPYARWVIYRLSGIEPLEDLLRSAGRTVEFVDEIEPFRRRKLLLVNGVHAILAIMAKRRDFALLNVYLNASGGALNLTEVQREFLEALMFSSAAWSQAELETFNSEVAERFKIYPDRVCRILARLEPQRLQSFMTDITRKAIEPMAYLIDKTNGEKLPSHIAAGLAESFELIEEGSFCRH